MQQCSRCPRSRLHCRAPSPSRCRRRGPCTAGVCQAGGGARTSATFTHPLGRHDSRASAATTHVDGGVRCRGDVFIPNGVYQDGNLSPNNPTPPATGSASCIRRRFVMQIPGHFEQGDPLPDTATAGMKHPRDGHGDGGQWHRGRVRSGIRIVGTKISPDAPGVRERLRSRVPSDEGRLLTRARVTSTASRNDLPPGPNAACARPSGDLANRSIRSITRSTVNLN